MASSSYKLIVVFIFILFVLSGCSKSNEKKAASFVEKARTLMAQNKPETALIEYKNAIQADPDNEKALFEMGEVSVVLGNINSAIRYYNLSIAANPKFIIPHIRLAQVYLQTDRLFKARDEISTVLELDPDSIDAFHILSGIQIRERDLDSAIETLSKAASIDSNNVKTYISLAQLYLKSQKVDAAKKAYIKAISIDSASRDAYMGLVRVFAYEQNFERVEALFKQIIETPGIKAIKYTDLAHFYEGRKKFDLAEKNYQKAVIEEPEGVLPLIHLAEFYTKRNMKEKAFDTMENALSKQSSRVLVLSAFSQIYFHFGMIEKAEKTIDEALSIDGDYVDALFQKGIILFRQNDYKNALNYFENVITKNRIYAQAYYYRALCINKRGATDRPEQKIFRAAAGMMDDPGEFENNQVKGNLLAALTVDPDLVDARIKLAQMYVREKNIVKAKDQLEEIFRRKAPDIEIMNLLSGIHILEGNSKEAENILKVIIEQTPDYIPAYIRLAILYDSVGDPVLALKYFLLAFDKNPEQLGLVNMMTDIHLKEKDFDGALRLLDQLSEKSGEEKRSFFENLRGEVYIQKGHTDAALAQFKKSIKSKPTYITPRMHLANYYFKQKQYLKAFEEYKRVEEINPAYIPALISIGTIYDFRASYDDAETYYRKVLQINPKHANAANNLAFILSEKPGQLEEAFRFAKIAVRQSPKDPNMLDTMGWILYQKGSYKNALSEFSESLDINPDSALATFHMGMTLYRLKEYETAKEYFTKALKIDPDFKGAQTAKKILD